MNNELNKEVGVLILEGDDLFGKEKFKEALERYESACEKSGHYLPLYKSGLLLGYLGRHQDAINKFEEAYPISAYRDKAKICCNWGIALDKLGRYEEAISRLSRAIELIPFYGKAYYYLATVFEKLRQSKQAENMFEDCIISGFDEVSNFYVDEHEKEFFKFSRINKHTLTSMSNKQIFFQIPKNFNDPFDSPLIALNGKDT